MPRAMPVVELFGGDASGVVCVRRVRVRLIVEVGWCTCCVVGTDAVLPSWSVER